MEKVADVPSSPRSEVLHASGLLIAAAALLAGVAAENPSWVRSGVSVVLLLPPLRLLTTIANEARARRFRVALTGVLALAMLVFSRWIT